MDLDGRLRSKKLGEVEWRFCWKLPCFYLFQGEESNSSTHQRNSGGSINAWVSREEGTDHDQPIHSSAIPLSFQVKRWVRTIDAPTLAFYALQMPKEPWKQLADTLHLSSRDFAVRSSPSVQVCSLTRIGKLVLRRCFRKATTSRFNLGGVWEVQQTYLWIKLVLIDRLTPKNVVSVLSAGHKIPYSYLRVKVLFRLCRFDILLY